MSELLLDSLEIKGYRCFKHLTIEKLGRVNLIVGKNNVGKTALLEALWIYVKKGSIDELIGFLKKREEFSVDEEFGETLWQINQLFYGSPNLFHAHEPITISPQSSPKNCLQVGVIWGHKKDKEKIDIRFAPTDSRRTDEFDSILLDAFVVCVIGGEFKGENKGRFIEIRSMFDNKKGFRAFDINGFHTEFRSHFIRSNGLDEKTVAEFWDRVSLTDKEDIIIDVIQIISPKVKRLTFIENDFYASRIPVIRLQQMKNAVPLKSLGEGMTKLLGTALTVVNSENGILLIDEIDTGLHYSVLLDVWRMVFRIARELNVQVFATTHSKDCIEAFAQAANESPEDGMLIRLERQGEKIVAKTISEERLVDAVEYDVEVR